MASKQDHPSNGNNQVDGLAHGLANPATPRARPGCNRWLELWRSQLGKKYAMAISGFILIAYVLVHLLGTLKVFAGPEATNAYADWLRTVGSPLLPEYFAIWALRVILLLSVIVHIVAAVQLVRLARAARPVEYAAREHRTVDIASRTMRWGGVVITLFIIFHVLHLTTGHAHHDFSTDVYRNIVSGFQQWYVSLFYIIACAALALHIYHGLWSALQTMGSTYRGFHRGGRSPAVVVAVVIGLGNISLPLAVMVGVIE
ncbi:succinate dehydrogenase cytochrome b subunit [Halorhodospira halochloris]|uniref:succinate dehydrogenase cytochrome b subunit n=1 Tax=Halorhodospira halochloris TaxID=1052 RepID=UPI001EE9A7D7|nr:succinate dehydrogenase cytochrome b subunit [Halorhodospira halochloris]MCG5530149.1 succinate dehydrogenase cytochrome b subunit [Halorhodospira halochloris]